MSAPPTTTTPPAADDPRYRNSPVRPRHPGPMRGVAVASVSLGFFSNIVFWWYPFGLILASVGLVLGLFALATGIRGGIRGERIELAGVGLCAFALTNALLVGQVLRYIDWNQWVR